MTTRPSYGPHLNSIEPLWGLMHKWVTHNGHYDTYEEFTEAITEFLETTLPENWEQFRDTITDNFKVISPKQYKIIQANKRRLMHFVQMVLNFDKMLRQINHDLQDADGV